MDFGEFLVSLLGRAEGGSTALQLGIAPVHLGGVTLFRLDNLTINMASSIDMARRDLPVLPDVDRVQDEAVAGGPTSQGTAADSFSSRTERGTPESQHVAGDSPVPQHNAGSRLAGPCRLEPLLVFDVAPPDDAQSEFEIAPRIRVAVVSATNTDVELTQFGPGDRKRYVLFEDRSPVGIQREPGGGQRVEFNRRRQARLENNEHWSFRNFVPGKPLRLAAGGEASGSVAVAVDRSVWAASWLLTRKDPQRRIRDSSFLVLLGR